MLFSHQVVSDSLQPHELHYASLPCPSLSPRVCSNLCPLWQSCHPPSHLLSPPPPPALNLSQHQGLFQLVIGASASAPVLPVNEYSGLISFRMDRFDLLGFQGTLKSLLQHHSSIRQCSAIFMIQILHLYITTGETIALTI